MDMQEVWSQIDKLFEENNPIGANEYMLKALNEAKTQNDNGACLQILNELLGYYRQTSDVENVCKFSDMALEQADKMGLKGSVPYATTTLNVANAMRAIGKTDVSLEYYKVTEDIYNENLSENDMLMAGMYNNYSLLLQEMNDYEGASKCLLKALDISLKNEARFEIATTYANLANTKVMLGDYGMAKQYAQNSIEWFKKINYIDAHYGAAVSALGMCSFEEKDYAKARDYFKEAMDLMEQSLGRNRQYDKIKANYEECVKKITGLELSRQYYETYGKKMIHEKFPEFEGRIAVGLVGEGSDCMGFDDEFSADHDFGPSFCMWVTDEVYDLIGEKLSEEYDKLPKEFNGYTYNMSRQGAGRRGVMKINAFYRKFLDATSYENIDWFQVYDYSLLSATDGDVFRDDEGIFTEFRNKLQAGYPENIRFLKLAEDVANFTQTGQYNYLRMVKRGDYITADLMLMEFLKATMKLYHHMLNVYPPHDKWLLKSTQNLDATTGNNVSNIIADIHNCMNSYSENTVNKVSDLIDQLADVMAFELYSRNYISDVENYLDVHTDELIRKSKMAKLDNDALVDAIAKQEFEAFDKVENEGGRASCQNNWPTFSIMRKSQYLTWDRDMLIQYLYDFRREYMNGHNLITEKYGRMMESTAPDRYEAIKDNFPVLSDEKKAIIEQIVAVQMVMMEEFAKEYPNVADNARSLHTYEDNFVNTSYETYLRGEISTYSDKMLQLYGRYVANCARNGINIARQTIENTAKLYGFKSIEEFANM